MSDKTVEIFLASSIDELETDRLHMQAFCSRLNDIYRKRGVYFLLHKCEDESIAMADTRKQEEYNEEIRKSDLCFILFFNHAGEFTLEEFEVAHKSFMEKGAPSVVVCFKRGSGYAPDQSIIDFMSELADKYGHYYKFYESIDSLKLSFLMQIKLMDLDVPIEFKDGSAIVDGTALFSLEKLPILANNSNYQTLKAEYSKCEAEFLDAKARYLADPTDDESFLTASSKRNNVRKALQELESNIYSLLMTAEEQSCKGTLTPRQRKAYQLLEAGDSKGANAILDVDDILEDAKHEEEMAQKIKERLCLRVNELMQKVAILRTLTDDPTRFAEIRRVYEAAVKLEEDNNLPKNAMLKFTDHLTSQCDYDTALSLAERLLKYTELENDTPGLAKVCHSLGMIYPAVGRAKDTEKILLRSLELFKELYESDRQKYANQLAITCNSLANYYYRLSQLDSAEQYYLQAKETIKDRLDYNDSDEIHSYVLFCNGLGLLYRLKCDYDKALSEHRTAVDICEANLDSHVCFSETLPLCYGSLSGSLLAKNDFDGALEYALKSVKFCEKAYNENPAANVQLLFEEYMALASVYLHLNQDSMALPVMLKAKELLNENDRELHAELCSQLAIVYTNMGDNENAESAFSLQEKLLKELFEDYPDVYEPSLAHAYHGFGNFYTSCGKFQQALEKLEKAQKIYDMLYKKEPKAYEIHMANITCSIGDVNFYTKNYAVAERYLKKAMRIFEKLSKTDRDAHSSRLAVIYASLSTLYYETEKDNASLEFAKKAVSILEPEYKRAPEATRAALVHAYISLGLAQLVIGKTEPGMSNLKLAKSMALPYAESHTYAALVAEVCMHLGFNYRSFFDLKSALSEYRTSKKYYGMLVKAGNIMYERQYETVSNALKQVEAIISFS